MGGQTDYTDDKNIFFTLKGEKDIYFKLDWDVTDKLKEKLELCLNEYNETVLSAQCVEEMINGSSLNMTLEFYDCEEKQDEEFKNLLLGAIKEDAMFIFCYLKYLQEEVFIKIKDDKSLWHFSKLVAKLSTSLFDKNNYIKIKNAIHVIMLYSLDSKSFEEIKVIEDYLKKFFIEQGEEIESTKYERTVKIMFNTIYNDMKKYDMVNDTYDSIFTKFNEFSRYELNKKAIFNLQNFIIHDEVKESQLPFVIKLKKGTRQAKWNETCIHKLCKKEKCGKNECKCRAHLNCMYYMDSYYYRNEVATKESLYLDDYENLKDDLSIADIDNQFSKFKIAYADRNLEDKKIKKGYCKTILNKLRNDDKENNSNRSFEFYLVNEMTCWMDSFLISEALNGQSIGDKNFLSTDLVEKYIRGISILDAFRTKKVLADNGMFMDDNFEKLCISDINSMIQSLVFELNTSYENEFEVCKGTRESIRSIDTYSPYDDIIENFEFEKMRKIVVATYVEKFYSV